MKTKDLIKLLSAFEDCDVEIRVDNDCSQYFIDSFGYGFDSDGNICTLHFKIRTYD